MKKEIVVSPSGSNGMSRRFVLGALVAMAALPTLPALLGSTIARADDATPLPSWNDGPAKRAILDFIKATTDASSKTFVPAEERVATFDQDGTLWVEHPIYTQLVYCLDRVPDVVKEKPALAKVEPFRTVLTGDFEKKLLKRYMVDRLGTPEDPAALISFLAGDDAGWITGQTYPINGGFSVTQ